MRMIGIILMAGPIIFGACSIKRQVEARRTVSTQLSAVETRSGIQRDSQIISLERAVRLDRGWIALEPHSGAVYRYDERMYIEETGGMAGSSVRRESTTAQREGHTEHTEFRSAETQSETREVAWGAMIAIGLLALWVVARWFRLWPFK